MKLLVVTRDAQRGTPVKKTVTAEWVRVGRHTSSEIYLPDPRVALAQGMIVWREGPVYIEGEGIAGKSTTRKAVHSQRLALGSPIEVGPYRIEAIEPPAGYDAAVSVELLRPLEVAPGLAQRTSRLTLASLGLTKRWAAWLWGLVVLALFLVLPAGRVLHMPWEPAAEAIGTSDRLWNPGRVMLAHEPIGAKCDSCHEVAFRHVRDQACLECHSTIGRHVARSLQQAALFEGQRCATCHRDHKGVKTTHRDDDTLCVSCHRDIRGKVAGVMSRNVTDFAADHPQFRVTLREGAGTRRVRMGEGPLVEATNLSFPHAKHLDPKGVKSPTKGRVQLECASCHKPDASGRSFEPISMAGRCQECHTLQFEPAVSAREVPHGKPEEAVAVIQDFYANLALQGTPDSFQKAFGVPGQGLLRRVGSPSDEERQNALALASRKAQRVVADLFEARVCKQCHVVIPAKHVVIPAKHVVIPAKAVVIPAKAGIQSSQAGAQSPYEIASVKYGLPRMPHARFDHKAHRQAKCADCHDVAQSKRAAEIAMPTIAACRECHGGSRPSENKVTSNCLLCHGFHDDGERWDPGFVPKARPRIVKGQAGAR